MTTAQRINQSSGQVEYYTPAPILDAARRVLGVIDLDPFSSAEANQHVRAERYYSLPLDGLSQPWFGRFWMNHPFGRVMNPLCVQKAEKECYRGEVEEGLCITFACTSEAWFQPLLRRPQCFLVPRTNYLLPDGTLLRGVTKGSVVTYYGVNEAKFAAAFLTLGVVKLPVP